MLLIQPAQRFTFVRSGFLRLLAAIYFIAFLSLVTQLDGLFSSRGILPVADLTFAIAHRPEIDFMTLPSIFRVSASDTALSVTAWIGIIASTAAAFLGGGCITFALLWAIYLSFVNVGQIFYGYGWESLLLEAGFLAIFTASGAVRDRSPRAPPVLLVFLYRWLLFRVMFGAGLIKLRSGDPCWRDLTCLVFHYETQPLPSPLSWYFHQLPAAAHHAGALFNHFVELLLPWFLFGGRAMAAIGGAGIAVFQLILILSGNLSFLNWLTLSLCIFAFDDTHCRRCSVPEAPPRRYGLLRRTSLILLACLIGWRSIYPIVNLLSPQQAMNASFDGFHLVNTYGAFGTVSRERHEVVIEGCDDRVLTSSCDWRAYELPCKPGDPDRRPCFAAPFQYRLDWQIWFAAMSRLEDNDWLVELVVHLLRGTPEVVALFARNPFPDNPPRYVRGELYRYRFASAGSDEWWTRERIGTYFPPLSLNDPALAELSPLRSPLQRLRAAESDR